MVSLFLAIAAGEDDRCDQTNLKLFSEIIIAIGYVSNDRTYIERHGCPQSLGHKMEKIGCGRMDATDALLQIRSASRLQLPPHPRHASAAASTRHASQSPFATTSRYRCVIVSPASNAYTSSNMNAKLAQAYGVWRTNHLLG